jgi:hypothetical protein
MDGLQIVDFEEKKSKIKNENRGRMRFSTRKSVVTYLAL